MALKGKNKVLNGFDLTSRDKGNNEGENNVTFQNCYFVENISPDNHLLIYPKDFL